MDIAAMNRSLDNDYGTTHGPNSPAIFELALYAGDPLAGGTELADTTEVDVLDENGDATGGTELVPNGYARAAVAHADFAPAADGVKSTTAPVQFDPAAAEWPDTVTHWLLLDADDGSAWDSGVISGDGLDVTGPGDGPAVSIAVFYADSVEEPA